ncbi:MAG: pilin [bacterium]
MSRKSSLFILSLLFSFSIFFIFAHAQTSGQAGYVPLASIPAPDSSGNIGGNGSNPVDLGTYFRQMYMLLVGIASALAVLMVIWGGVEYITTDAIGGKEEGKQKVQNAILGLILALGSYLILQTINPALLNTNLVIPKTKNLAVSTAQVGALTNGSQPAASNPSYDAWTNWTDQNQNDLDSAYAKGLKDLTPAEQAAVDQANANQTNQDFMNKQAESFTGGSTSKGSGNIATDALNGMTFPSGSGVTNQQMLDFVNNSGILSANLSAEDKLKYFPDGNVTAQGYVNLLAAIANSESGFNPNDNTTQHLKDAKASFSSEGLFSLSVGDPAVISIARDKGITPQDVINNPTYNAQAAVNIMTSQVKANQSTGNGISVSNGYWGPLRRGE